jgi:hypothetical protein
MTDITEPETTTEPELPPPLPEPLVAAINAAKDAEARGAHADQNRDRAVHESKDALARSGKYLEERDEQYRECGRQILKMQGIFESDRKRSVKSACR